jgi:amino-acid N-acetyltransferase
MGGAILVIALMPLNARKGANTRFAPTRFGQAVDRVRTVLHDNGFLGRQADVVSGIRRARKGDLPAVLALVRSASLPTAGLEDQFPGAYRVAGESGAVAAVCGLERCGSFGLLRSLAVAEGSRGAGIGGALVKSALARARRGRLEAVFLLTPTAAGFFAKRGFEPVGREAAPPAIRATVEFASACPASAALMRHSWTKRRNRETGSPPERRDRSTP